MVITVARMMTKHCKAEQIFASHTYIAAGHTEERKRACLLRDPIVLQGVEYNHRIRAPMMLHNPKILINPNQTWLTPFFLWWTILSHRENTGLPEIQNFGCVASGWRCMVGHVSSTHARTYTSRKSTMRNVLSMSALFNSPTNTFKSQRKPRTTLDPQILV